MADQPDEQNKAAAAAATAPQPVTKKTIDERLKAKSLTSDDPFIKDMAKIANNSELDGNARVQSPQTAGNGEGPREDEN